MSDDASAKPGAGTTAGRGVVLIAFAKLYFMFIGLFVQIRLTALVSRGVFGAYGVINSMVSPVNSVMITGSIQTVSRFTAQEPHKARLVQQAGLRMHLYVGLVVSAVFIAGAPLLAWFLHDPSKTAPLMLAGVIIGIYAFYAVFVGTANGLRQFHKQAGLDIAFATLRTVGLLGMAMAGMGVLGVIGGWAIAAGLILTIAATWVGLPRAIPAAERLPVRPMISYLGQVAVYLILFNLLLFVDTMLLKRLTSVYFAAHSTELASAMDAVLPWARQTAGYQSNPAALADVQVAYYTAVQTLARLSYQAIIAATFVVFPLVSRSTFAEDRDTTRKYIEITVRYSLIFAAAIAVTMAANPAAMLAVVYPADYAALGGPALAALALGTVAFALVAIAGTILNGAGLTRLAIISAAITLGIAATANYVALSRTAPGPEALWTAAVVTAAAMVVGAAISGYLLWSRLGGFLPWKTLVRVGAAGAAALAVGQVLSLSGKIGALVEATLVGASFLGVLIALGELGRRDLAAIRSVRSRRGGGDA
ncbi:MAG: oligosaccharide flippase family protein [Myxococcales bacterium]|nr:oligosaccharide flippase family protein [Myxococcales bacterium]